MPDITALTMDDHAWFRVLGASGNNNDIRDGVDGAMVTSDRAAIVPI